MNLADGLSAQASAQPYGIAVIRGGRTISFGQLDVIVWRFARWLKDKGVAPRDVVGLTFADEVRHLIASLALVRMGAVQIALPASDPAAMRNEMARRAGATLILTGEDTPAGTEQSCLAAEFAAVAASRDPIDPGVRAGTLSWPFLFGYGSGTTGRPKLMLRSAEQHLLRRGPGAGAARIRPGERLLFQSTFDYSGVKRRRLDYVLFGGTNIFVAPGETIPELCNMLRVDHLRLVARQAEELLAGSASRPTPSGHRMPHLRSLNIGSSVISEALRASMRSLLTENVVVGYGTNEVGVVATASPTVQDRYPGSVGHAVTGAVIEVVDSDDRPLPPGEVGEVRICAPGMITGYHDDPEATAKVFRNGWFYPRDLGSFTPDGVLIFHGRADDMMILDGINIFPREIELALEGHPAVAEAVAFPVAHPVHQDVPAAVVVLREPAIEQDLIAFCRERIGRHAPRHISILPAIPDAARGKVMKRDLAALFGLTAQPEAPNESG